jgi:hypothetical protein
VIIHESDFPLLHQCLLDKTHGWAYFYLDLISWLIVPLIFLWHLMKKGPSAA